jgi:hypothetical protein
MDAKRVPITTRRRQSEARRRHSLHDRRPNVNALPEQFFESRISLASVCPETALMYAVLEDALFCFQETLAGSPHQQRCRDQKAARWFFSNDQHSPYSFVRICAELGLDPEDIRNKLRYLGQDTRGKPISRKKTLHRPPQPLVIAGGLPAPGEYRAARKEPL